MLVLSDASGFTGTRSFTVLYTVSGLVSAADGVQTLQLPLLSAKGAYPISRYQFTVTMPKPFEGYPAFVSGYYSDVISDYIDLDVSESLISGMIATGLKDHESLDMTLTLDKSYFSGAYTALSFSWVGMAVIVALLALAFGYWFVTLRSAPIRTSTRMLPPDARTAARSQTLSTPVTFRTKAEGVKLPGAVCSASAEKNERPHRCAAQNARSPASFCFRSMRAAAAVSDSPSRAMMRDSRTSRGASTPTTARHSSSPPVWNSVGAS